MTSLQALLRALPAEAKPCITAADQQQVQQRFGVSTCDRHRLRSTLSALADCDGLILGGGSLLQDGTSWRSLLYYAALILTARLQRKPVVSGPRVLAPCGVGVAVCWLCACFPGGSELARSPVGCLGPAACWCEPRN